MPGPSVTVPFADLSRQWTQIAERVRPDLDRLFSQSAFCLGPWVADFEARARDFLGVRHAIGVNSGTSALHLALIAAGVGPGDRVLVPSMTFIATAWAVLYVGAEPILCDVDPDTGTIDPADAERRIDKSVRAIVPVHLYGRSAAMDRVLDVARRYRLAVIEDACQAFGARWQGRCVGGLGRLGCFSFYPGKNLGAAGEGGLVVTGDDDLAERIRALRDHGQRQRYVHEEVGFNYRMDGIQGLILGHKLPFVDQWADQRRAIARRYLRAFADLPLYLPHDATDGHVWHLFVVRCSRRDGLRAHLEARGVETGMHYPVPLHRQPCLAAFGFQAEDLSVADCWGRECLSLPLFVGMTEGEVEQVVEGVRSFFG